MNKSTSSVQFSSHRTHSEEFHSQDFKKTKKKSKSPNTWIGMDSREMRSSFYRSVRRESLRNEENLSSYAMPSNKASWTNRHPILCLNPLMLLGPLFSLLSFFRFVMEGHIDCFVYLLIVMAEPMSSDSPIYIRRHVCNSSTLDIKQWERKKAEIQTTFSKVRN